MRKVSILMSVFLVITFNCWSQTDGGQIDTKEIVIEKNKKIELGESIRLFEKMIITEKTPYVAEPQKYKFKEFYPTLPSVEANIKILTIKKDDRVTKKQNYVKGGFGNYATTYLEAFLSHKFNQKLILRSHLGHLASARGPSKFARNSDNWLRLDAEYLGKKHTIVPFIEYVRSRQNYYGNINENFSINKDSIKQVYNKLHTGIEISNQFSGKKLEYKIIPYLDLTVAKTKQSEVDGGYDSKFQYEVNSKYKVELGSNLSIINYKQDSLSRSRVLFTFNPSILGQEGNLKYKIGFNTSVTNDTVNKVNPFHIFPSLRAEYPLVGKSNIFLGIDGGAEKMTYSKLITQNPFVGNNLVFSHAYKNIDLFLGTNIGIKPGVDLHLLVSQSWWKNKAFTVNNPLDSNGFIAVYDKKTISITNLRAELMINTFQKLTIKNTVDYKAFKLNSLTAAYSVPTLTNSFFAEYNLYKKLYINSQFNILSGITSYNTKEQKNVNLPVIYDFNIGTRYYFSEKVGGFINFYNIFNKKYQQFYQYSNKGINFMVGVTYSF